jgi:hypothetical protein
MVVSPVSVGDGSSLDSEDGSPRALGRHTSGGASPHQLIELQRVLFFLLRPGCSALRVHLPVLLGNAFIGIWRCYR